ncbi:MAG TPA: flavodoxin domain-containing protein [Myxococcaceae bacterium]|nr:flavodoxin domain-containing protein [Myxococcaceae bacterium]
MKPFLIVYASRSGYTHHIAECIADRIRTLAREVQVQDVRTEALPPLKRYSGVVLAAGVHFGHHERDMVKFVRARRRELAEVPTVFLSVSLTEGTATDVHQPDDVRLEARNAARKILDDFAVETGWRPRTAIPIAGAMTRFRHGSPGQQLARRLFHRRLPEGPTPTIAFNDWSALNAAVDGLVREAVAESNSGSSGSRPETSFGHQAVYTTVRDT